MINIALFASGTGSNVQALIEAQKSGRFQANLVALVCDNKQAAVIDKARQAKIEVLVLSPKDCGSRQAWEATVIDFLQERQVDLIVLAGFMRKIEQPLTTAYAGRIVNIHPSLLPLHGGPGMYGHHVHEAVLADGDSESGITIHYVDEQIDGGEIIFQAKCEVLPDDTPDTLANRIHVLEHRHFPQVIESVLTK